MQHELLLRLVDEEQLRAIIRDEITRAFTSMSLPDKQSEPPGKPELLTLRETRLMLRISSSTLHRRMQDNAIHTVRVGKRRLVSSTEIRRLMGDAPDAEAQSTRRWKRRKL